MKFLPTISILILFIACQNSNTEKDPTVTTTETASVDSEFTLVFASCNDQDREQPLWKPILSHEPDLFVWGGDNVYADTDDMAKMESDYDKVKAHPDYKKLMERTTITGTWDDHDFGKNDAGSEWEMKDAAKEQLLNFLDVPENDPRWDREGVYTAETYELEGEGTIKLILLDTRYFRTALKASEEASKRYDPWTVEDGGTILGDTQWSWLAEELADAAADFNVIVSSIQFLSNEHGWEKWANHPAEVVKLQTLIAEAKARNIMILSGDRHLGEISKDSIAGKDYPLIDFTSSGLTHTWPKNATEANDYRTGNVIKTLNFGVLRFNFATREVTFQLRGPDDFLYEEYKQVYR